MELPILIIGLGHAGQRAALKYLASGKQVIGVDFRDFFYNIIAACELIVEPEADSSKVAFPYKLMTEKYESLKFLQGDAADYDAENGIEISLPNNKKLSLRVGKSGLFEGDADTLPDFVKFALDNGVERIICGTGTVAQLPLKPSTHIKTFDQISEAWIKLHQKIHKASRALVIGAGAVGCEFTGYLHDIKPGGVVLASAGPVMKGFTDTFSLKTSNQLQKMLGANFLENTRVTTSYQHDQDFPSFVFFDTPTDIAADTTNIKEIDFIFYAYSRGEFSKPALSRDCTMVDRKMKSINHPELSIIGDQATFQTPKVSDQKMGWIAMAQGDKVIEDVDFDLGDTRIIINPMGKSYGTSLMPFPLLGECAVGSTTTWLLTKAKESSMSSFIKESFQ